MAKEKTQSPEEIKKEPAIAKNTSQKPNRKEKKAAKKAEKQQQKQAKKQERMDRKKSAAVSEETSDEQQIEEFRQRVKKTDKKEEEQRISAQDTIPYINVYSNGMIETEPNHYSKSYLLNDKNFRQATAEDQQKIYKDYCALLSSFDYTIEIEITIYNQSINMEQFKENVFLGMRDDGNNKFREEYNKMLTDKMQEARNNIRKVIILTLSTKVDTIEEAIHIFRNLDTQVDDLMNHEAEPMSAVQRLELLHNIYNMNTNEQFLPWCKTEKRKVNALKNLRKHDMTTKDLVAPDSMEFPGFPNKADYFKIGDTYGRAMFLVNYPTDMNSNILTNLANIPCNMCLSVHFKVENQINAIRKVKNRRTDISADVIKSQKKAAREGYSGGFVSYDLQTSQEEADFLMDDLIKRGQKMVFTTVVGTIFADNPKDLDSYEATLTSIAGRNMFQMKKLRFQQEDGFATSLPLGTNRLSVDRMLTTETAGLFIPYESKELIQPNGAYFGLNAESKSLVLFSRVNTTSGNGVILGKPGGGKSFKAKETIVNRFLSTDDEIYVLDPENEYGTLAKLFGGEVVSIKPSGNIHINPFDMTSNYAGEDSGDDPVALKSDYILALCEIAIGDRYGLSARQKTIIDRCVKNIYEGYMEHLMKNNITEDREQVPTMTDFYMELKRQPEVDAQDISLQLERYITGSMDIFAHHTNINIKNRFTVYNLKDVGSNLKKLALHVCLNNVWTKAIQNFYEGKRTWLFIDEFYLLASTDVSASFMQEIWKRGRKWHMYSLGITQDVEDMLQSGQTRAIINNSDMVLLFSQSEIGRELLTKMYSIPNALQRFISSSAREGEGLLIASGDMIPIIDKFPKDTQLYKAMTTKPDEVNAASRK